MSKKESILLKDKHVLICVDNQVTNLDPLYSKELEYIKNNFCGIVFYDMKSFNEYVCQSKTIIYLIGNIKKNYNEIQNVQNKLFNVIEELSYNYNKNENEKYKLIDIGQVPINIYNVGVYFRNFFNPNKDYFNLINSEHQFQELTESNKPTSAFRKGIYLTKVEDINDEIKFKLLRCSSNLHGPTDNFRNTDNEIVNQVNKASEYFFEESAELNHVLAQIYENKIVKTDDDKQVERKAKIKDHSDKTKDMPRNGLIAFCTFYKNYSDNKFNGAELKHIKKSNNDHYDHCFNDTSVLTKICFRLKENVNDSSFKKKFDITLYPNSVFIISLSTNRLYTHEIVPSVLPVDKICTTRLGYVIRCSKTEAIFKDGQTYINENGNYVKLEEPNEKDVKELKGLYFKENTSNDMIHYDKVYFSLNNGDYEKPIA